MSKSFGTKFSGFPLRSTLILAIVLVALLSSASVGIIAFTSGSTAIQRLWQGLSKQLADNTVYRTTLYFSTAAPFTMASTELVSKGVVQPEAKNPLPFFDYALASLDANPNFTWISFSTIEGSYMTVYRHPELGRVAEIRSIIGENEDGSPKTTLSRYAPEEMGWKLLETWEGSYDPRKRAWWKQALEHPQGSWSDPYLFWSRHQPGLMYMQPQEIEGKVAGVWAVEYEISYLSQFVKTLDFSEHGQVYLVADNGLVVATPNFRVVKAEEQGSTDPIFHAKEHPNEWLVHGWQEYQNAKQDMPTFQFEDQGQTFLGVIQHFPKSSKIPWVVIIVAPESDFFGHLYRGAWLSLAQAAAWCIVIATLGGILFGKISSALARIAKTMNVLSTFKFGKSTTPESVSLLQEVNIMSDALGRLQNSLFSFGKYVPSDLVSDLLLSGTEATLGGKKENITLLFADLVNFTTLSEKYPTDLVVELLGRYFNMVSEVVNLHHGVVDKYIGDAVMAFWGTPHPLEHHELHACRAALDMQKKMHSINQHLPSAQVPILSHRIGINTGNVIVGNIGSQTRINYTAMGDPVNLASRLEALNRILGTQILVGQDTAEAVQNEMLLRPLGKIAVKGKTQAAFVYELVADKKDALPEQEEFITQYADALQYFIDKDFTRALPLFQKCSTSPRGQDAPSLFMTQICQKFINTPPDATWEGIIVMKEK